MDAPKQDKQQFIGLIREAVYRLYQRSQGGDSAAKGLLSRLRNSAGYTPEERPVELAELLMELFPEFPEKYVGRGDQPSAAEIAAFSTLSLYALHQQSEQRCMSDSSCTFAQAVGELVKHREGGQSLKARFDSLVTAPSLKAMIFHLRAIIGLLKTAEQPFDYGRLANDLRTLQWNAKGRKRVQLRWSLDFARAFAKTPTEHEK